MALADVLSAVRQLILDNQRPPIDPAPRKTWLAERFPGLSPTELDDLAAVPPERLEVYTDLIFAGERATLQWVYPMTFAVLHRLRGQEEGDANLADFDLIRSLHEYRPWSSQSTRELAACFQDFLTECRPQWTNAWSGLPDLVDFERTDLEVFYAQDIAHQPITNEMLAQFTQMSVEELMQVKVMRPSFAVIREYTHDVIALAEHWHAEEGLPASLPTVSPPSDSCRVACGRPVDTLLTRWIRLTPAGHAALSALVPNQPTSLNDVAATYLSAEQAASPCADDAQRFADFFRHFRDWLWGGLLLRPKVRIVPRSP